MIDNHLDLSKLTEAEKAELIKYHVDALRRLRASMLRSDWHAAFEAALRISTDKYGEAIRLMVEEELGIEPPRADFIVLLHDPEVRMEEAIFTHFKSVNILEYKNPNDDLNESVLWKAIGYAGLYISNRNVTGDDVTITIFRARRNEEFFSRLSMRDQLQEMEVPGVYRVVGVTEIEARIVITDDLKGEQYAAYRALSDKPSLEDLKALVRVAEQDETKRAYVRTIFNHTAKKHPELIEEIRREDKTMNEAMLAIFKDEIEQKRTEGRIQMCAEMVEKGLVTIDQAASALNMTVPEFKAAVESVRVIA